MLSAIYFSQNELPTIAVEIWLKFEANSRWGICPGGGRGGGEVSHKLLTKQRHFGSRAPICLIISGPPTPPSPGIPGGKPTNYTKSHPKLDTKKNVTP